MKKTRKLKKTKTTQIYKRKYMKRKITNANI